MSTLFLLKIRTLRQAQGKKLIEKMEKILYLFHHIHHLDGKHSDGGHEVHHCGGRHKDLDYNIEHCKCGKHTIDKEEAEGHDFNENSLKVKFYEKCLEGGWHIESGKIIEK